jgi:hypothetical protein
MSLAASGATAGEYGRDGNSDRLDLSTYDNARSPPLPVPAGRFGSERQTRWSQHDHIQGNNQNVSRGLRARKDSLRRGARASVAPILLGTGSLKRVCDMG